MPCFIDIIEWEKVIMANECWTISSCFANKQKSKGIKRSFTSFEGGRFSPLAAT